MRCTACVVCVAVAPAALIPIVAGATENRCTPMALIGCGAAATFPRVPPGRCVSRYNPERAEWGPGRESTASGRRPRIARLARGSRRIGDWAEGLGAASAPKTGAADIGGAGGTAGTRGEGCSADGPPGMGSRAPAGLEPVGGEAIGVESGDAVVGAMVVGVGIEYEEVDAGAGVENGEVVVGAGEAVDDAGGEAGEVVVGGEPGDVVVGGEAREVVVGMEAGEVAAATERGEVVAGDGIGSGAVVVNAVGAGGETGGAPEPVAAAGTRRMVPTDWVDAADSWDWGTAVGEAAGAAADPLVTVVGDTARRTTCADSAGSDCC